MKKTLAMVMAALLTLTLWGAAAAGVEEEKVLNVFSWEGYIDATTLGKFTEQTGIKVNYTTFLSNEEMLIKMQKSDNGFDVVLASDYAVNMLRKQNLLAKLDRALLPNYKNLGPEFLSQYYDENNEYTVPYTSGSPLIVYNPDALPKDLKLTGYNSLWDERLRDSLIVIDDARVMIGIVLKSMGESMNTTDPAILAKAKEKLFQLRPNIRAFNYDTPYIDLLNGEASVAFMFTPFVLIAQQENPNLATIYPEEGMGFGIDSLVISASAPHPKNAHALLNYLLDAQTAAFVAQQQLYLSPVAAAREYIPEALRNNEALKIMHENIGKMEYVKDIGEFASQYQAIWTEFKQLAK